MNTREKCENKEKKYISKFGCLSLKSKGRKLKEEQCKIRTAFQVDKDRILYSKAFRRLKHKTQVFLNPISDDYRTRLTHTLEVAQISRTIAKALSLNEDLTEAIALGHDIGHTPFGHIGEIILQQIHSINFSHNKQAIRIVKKIENKGKGLNLTHEVLDGILKHSKGYGKIIPVKKSELAITLEGCVVRISDIIAYINHDLDDAIRNKIISIKEIPTFFLNNIGKTHQKRLINMIKDVIHNSIIKNEKLKIKLSKNMTKSIILLRNFLYEKVYKSKKVNQEFIKAKKIISELYKYFCKNKKNLQIQMKKIGILTHLKSKNLNKETVSDFIASISDIEAINIYKKIIIKR